MTSPQIYILKDFIVRRAMLHFWGGEMGWSGRFWGLASGVWMLEGVLVKGEREWDEVLLCGLNTLSLEIFV